MQSMHSMQLAFVFKNRFPPLACLKFHRQILVSTLQ